MAKKLTDAEKIRNFLGVDLSAVLNNPEIVEAEHQQTEYESLEDNRALEAESVIFYIETKGADSIWKRKNCKQCGSPFLSSYTGVSYCSNECRKDFLASKGMIWDPTGRSESERWGGTIPRIIGPEATKKLQAMEFIDEPEPTITPPPVAEDDEFDLDDFING